jgi:hypothetical protein
MNREHNRDVDDVSRKHWRQETIWEVEVKMAKYYRHNQGRPVSHTSTLRPMKYFVHSDTLSAQEVKM